MTHDGPQPTYELCVCYLIVGLVSDQPSDFLRDEELHITMMLIHCPEIKSSQAYKLNYSDFFQKCKVNILRVGRIMDGRGEQR